MPPPPKPDPLPGSQFPLTGPLLGVFLVYHDIQACNLTLRLWAFPGGANIGASSISLTCVAIGFAIASTNRLIIHSASLRTLRTNPLSIAVITLIHWLLAKIRVGGAPRTCDSLADTPRRDIPRASDIIGGSGDFIRRRRCLGRIGNSIHGSLSRLLVTPHYGATRRPEGK